MTLDDIMDIRAIEQLKYRYMRAVDTHDWVLMERCFAHDASIWYGNGLYSFTGLADILAFFRSVITPSFIGSHIALHPEITLVSPDRATGIWRLQDIVHVRDADTAARESDFQGGEKMEGAAYYHDDYVRTRDDWLIHRTGYVRIFETITPRSGRPAEHLKVDTRLGMI